MSINAAQDHYNWRVQIGHHNRAPNWSQGCALLWDKIGHGCLVHPRIVLTSLTVWSTAESNRHGYEVLVRPFEDESDADNESDDSKGDELSCKCQLVHSDKLRDLAAVVLDKSFRDRKGNELTNFPEIADAPPAPGQVLCVLSTQYLRSGDNYDSRPYICFTYGSVCLLREESNVLFALSGILTDEIYLGAAVFDERGKPTELSLITSDILCSPSIATRPEGRAALWSSLP